MELNVLRCTESKVELRRRTSKWASY